MDLLDGDVELTEFEAIDVQSIKGVAQGANGFPILMMKGLAPAADTPAAKAADDPAEPEFDREAAKALAKAVLADLTASPRELYKAAGKRGQVDEAPDIDLGNQIIALLGQAIAAEAQEVAAGNAGEVCDIQELACALQIVRCWRDGEQAVSLGDVMPASMLMQSAAGTQDVASPPSDKDDTSKSQIAPEETTVDTVTQETGGLTKAVEDAIAKATAPLEERVKALDAELAKVKAAPVPNGMVLSRNVQVKQPGAVVREDQVAKAAYFREQAQIWDSQDRGTADGYRQMAREADAKAVTPPS